MQIHVRRHTRAADAKAGFTLVEILVGMTLMAIIFTAAFGTHFLAMRMVEDARHQIRASQIIQSELEAMRTLNWNDLEALVGSAQFSLQGRFSDQFAGRYQAYRSVQNLSATQKEVVISVRWEVRGTWQYQYFNTIFTKNGLNDYHYRAV